MQIAICPHCDQRIEADASYVGKIVKCPSCGGDVSISSPGRKIGRSIFIEMNQNKSMIVSMLALALALIAIFMQLGFFPRSKLDFKTPESAIKSTAELNQSGSFMDYRRMNRLFLDDSDWESISPDKIEIAKTLEVKGTGDADYDGGVLCFIKFRKSDGVDSYNVVFLKKTKKELFRSSYIGLPIQKAYGTVIENWEKNGTL